MCVRKSRLAPFALLVLTATACGGQEEAQNEAAPRSLDRSITVSASQIAEDTRVQAAAERQPLDVLRTRPSGATDAQSWRTLAVSHDDHRLLLAVNLGACDRFLGVAVIDTVQQVTVEPLVMPSTATACVKRLDTVVGYVDFAQPLGKRLTTPASP